MPDNKREIYYLGGGIVRERGTDWYFSLTEGCNGASITGDVSVEYLYDPAAAKAVQAHLPQVKLIAILRNPVERAISAYFWKLRRGRVKEFDLNKGLRRAIDAWNQRTASNEIDRPSHEHDLIARGLYSPQLVRYVRRFPLKNLLVINYAEIMRQPEQVIHAVYDFIGVDASHQPSVINSQPKRNSYNPLLMRLEHAAPDLPLMGAFVDALHRSLYWFGGEREKPELQSDVRKALLQLYRPYDQALWDLLRDLPSEQCLFGPSLEWEYE